MTQLPEQFLKNMSELLGVEYEDYLKSFEVPRIYGMRINTEKIQPKEYEQISPCELKPIHWITNGYYYDGETEKPAKDPYYYAGLYYLQEPSAMTPASILPVNPGDKVLDLCAAPGGKSTELGARLKGEGLLVANDISNSRAKALLKNLELFGIPNICVTSETPEKLEENFPQYFDKILIDAPCSGEGMFRKDPDMVKSWAEHGPEYYAEIQRGIVTSALHMLKAGGYLLYSTCTFAQMEDEDIVRFMLEQDPELELVQLDHFEGAAAGIGLHGCIRLFPHKIQGEGHFLALLHKKGEPAETGKQEHYKGDSIEKLKELQEFLKLINIKFDKNRIMVKNNQVYYLPEYCSPRPSLRYLRTGLLLGELKKDRFEPAQALAMALHQDEFKQTVSFERADDRVIRYLKGETIALQDGEQPVKGWCLVCVDGFPLGFAKGNGMTLKNKYYAGWRWM